MPDAHGRSPDDAARVDAAIATVLNAEREARDAVARCAREAESIVEQAQETAREIARGAAQRTVRVQRWSAEELQRRVDAVAARHAQIGQAAAHAGGAVSLSEIIEALATELTAGRP